MMQQPVAGTGTQMLVPVFPAAQMRPKEPPTFKGDLNEDIDAWYSLVQDYCHLMGTSEAQNVAYMATLLQGAARVFWDSVLRASGGRRPASMMEFIAILRQRFLSPMHERQARVTLWSIGQRQAESVHAFSCRFQNLLQRLTTYDAIDILEHYIRALHPELRLAVAQKDPKTLQEAIYFSEHLELLTASYGTRSSSGSTSQSQSASYQPQQGHQGQSNRQRKQQKRGGGSGGQQQQLVEPPGQ